MELVLSVKVREPEEVWVEEEEGEQVPGDSVSVLPVAKKFLIRQEFLVLL